MIKKDTIFNCWQIYDECQKIYKEKNITEAFRQCNLLNTREDVLTFNKVVIDNDVMFIVKNESSIVFSFIGSNDAEDWFDNFDLDLLTLDKENNIKVHDGFYNSAERFSELIVGNILDAPKNNIYFIGHSRGGALAMISAISAAERTGKGDFNIITYGQPRVGNHEYDKLLISNRLNYCRVLFKHDIVTKIPPILLGYEHPWFGDKLVLKASLWHKLPFMFKKVHLDYNRYINNELIKEVYINRDIV